jgi:hypothetical protein
VRGGAGDEGGVEAFLRGIVDECEESPPRRSGHGRRGGLMRRAESSPAVGEAADAVMLKAEESATSLRSVLLDDAGVGEEGEELAFSAAVGTGQHVQDEDALEELPRPFSGSSCRGDLAAPGCGPGVPSPRPWLARGVGRVCRVRRSARVLAVDLRVRLVGARLVGVRVVVGFGSRLGNDAIAEGGGGSEDPVVGGEVYAGSRIPAGGRRRPPSRAGPRTSRCRIPDCGGSSATTRRCRTRTARGRGCRRRAPARAGRCGPTPRSANSKFRASPGRGRR